MVTSAHIVSVTHTLRVAPIVERRGYFQVVDDENRILGTSKNEMMAIWAAVIAAEEISKSGCSVRVVAFRHGKYVEEFVARPPQQSG
jgi:hypothetical protein